MIANASTPKPSLKFFTFFNHLNSHLGNNEITTLSPGVFMKSFYASSERGWKTAYNICENITPSYMYVHIRVKCISRDGAGMK